MKAFSRYLPWLIVTLAGAYLIWTMFPPKDPDGQAHLQELGKVPVVDGGRVKPLDTVARTSLMLISNRQYFVDEDDRRQPAIRWLADVMVCNGLFKKFDALDYKVFRIENDQVLSMLGLKPRPGFYRYSFNEFRDQIDKIEEEALRARAVDAKKQTTFDVKILHLRQQIQLFRMLSELRSPLLVPPSSEARESGDQKWRPLDDILTAHLQLIQRFFEARKKPLEQDRLVETFWIVMERGRNPSAILARVLHAYAEDDPKAFNSELAGYRTALEREYPDETETVGFEAFFNHFDPFSRCIFLYVCVFLLTCLGWLGWQEPLNRAAFWLMVLVLAVHSWGLYARMYIQGRPPITNLYSSAVYVGWGCVGLGLILERIYRNGLGNALGTVLGYATLLFADYLAQSGDTLEMMQAVLDTNFWLATHVTCVALGYTATLVAGFLGIGFVLRMLCGVVRRYLEGARDPATTLITFTVGLPILGFVFGTCGVYVSVRRAVDDPNPSLAGLTRKMLARFSLGDEAMRTLGQMIYGIVCFAMFLSFTGTVLGGIWADQSWGRFWGWDPKENGALLIVLWNALILHARWGGLIKQRGLAVLAICGNMVTGWSWVGTNQLGVGLHAYGFNNTLAFWLVIFWAFSLASIGLGLLPARLWRGAPSRSQEPPPPAPERKPRERRETSTGITAD